MATADDFLQAILADPDDDVPRLVFADWLEEQGNRRSEFIRIQCEREHLSEDDPRRADLEARSQMLQTVYEQAWLGGLRSLVHRWHFRRGFVHGVQLTAKNFLTHAETLFRLAPLRHVTLSEVNPCLKELVESPYLARLTSLDIKPEFSWFHFNNPDNQLDDAGCRLLVFSPHLANLRRLDLGWNRIGNAGVRELIQSPHLTELTNLDLSHNECGMSSCELLAGSSYVRHLKQLSLGNNNLGDSGVRYLASGQALAELMQLHLESNEIVAKGIMELASSPLAGRLTHLTLDGNILNPAYWSTEGFQNIRVLSLNSVTGSSGAFAILLGMLDGMKSLTRLSMRHNYMKPLGAEVVSTMKWNNLRHLDLAQNQLGDAGAVALTKAQFVHCLSTLDLTDNNIGDEGAKALAESPLSSHIAEIRLGNNPISSAGQRALQASFGHRLILDGKRG